MIRSDRLVLPGHIYVVIMKSSLLQRERNFYVECSIWHMEHVHRKPYWINGAIMFCQTRFLSVQPQNESKPLGSESWLKIVSRTFHLDMTKIFWLEVRGTVLLCYVLPSYSHDILLKSCYLSSKERKNL